MTDTDEVRPGILLAVAGWYVLCMVLGSMAIGGVGWPVRLPALGAAAVVLAVGIGPVRRALRPLLRAADRKPFPQDGPQFAATFATSALAFLLAVLWRGQYGLLVLAGVLAALPHIAAFWWTVRRARARR